MQTCTHYNCRVTSTSCNRTVLPGTPPGVVIPKVVGCSALRVGVNGAEVRVAYGGFAVGICHIRRAHGAALRDLASRPSGSEALISGETRKETSTSCIDNLMYEAYPENNPVARSARFEAGEGGAH